MYPEGVAEMMCSHKRSARKDRWMDRRRENITPPATAIAGADALTLHCVRLTGKPWMIFFLLAKLLYKGKSVTFKS